MADCHIFQVVPGLETVRFPVGKLHSVFHVYRHLTGSSPLGEVLSGVFVSSSCSRSRRTFLRFRIHHSDFPRC